VSRCQASPIGRSGHDGIVSGFTIRLDLDCYALRGLAGCLLFRRGRAVVRVVEALARHARRVSTSSGRGRAAAVPEELKKGP
jgi:hypothetical protein